MTTIVPAPQLAGVKYAQLQIFRDERGHFLETFRKEWFPERTWTVVQSNCSFSRVGVLRGLHYHRHQADYWYVPHGRIRVGLVDVRRGSPSFGASEMVEIGDGNTTGILIPQGIAHGFLALTDATLIYVVDNYYDGEDEFGVAWNDPGLALSWGTETPILSIRDHQNPHLRDIPAGLLPAPYRDDDIRQNQEERKP